MHRDLKPGNVMITPRGAAKVLEETLAPADVELTPDDLLEIEDTTAEIGGRYSDSSQRWIDR